MEPSPYRDVITHFLGGETDVVRNVEVDSLYGQLGAQSVYLVTPKIAFSVTAAIHRPEVFKVHQRRFLSHTSLNAMHWINIAGSSVSICTIHR